MQRKYNILNIPKHSNASSGVQCSECRYDFPNGNEIGAMKYEERPSCPRCGSDRKTFNISLVSTIKVRSLLSMKSKQPGRKRPLSEQKVGDELHVDSNTWRKIHRLIDHVNDQYDETIEDDEGNIVRDVHEPLSQHWNRGGAKNKKRPKDS